MAIAPLRKQYFDNSEVSRLAKIKVDASKTEVTIRQPDPKLPVKIKTCGKLACSLRRSV